MIILLLLDDAYIARTLRPAIHTTEIRSHGASYLQGGEITEIVGEAPTWMILMSLAPSASSYMQSHHHSCRQQNHDTVGIYVKFKVKSLM